MRIPVRAYKLFYNNLIDKFRDDHIPLENLKGIKYRSSKIWELKIGTDILPKSKILTGNYTAKTTIFYDILCRANATDGDSYAKINDELLINALEFLKVALPSSFDYQNLDEEKKAKILFQCFLDRSNEGQNYIIEYPELKAFNYAETSSCIGTNDKIKKVVNQEYNSGQDDNKEVEIYRIQILGLGISKRTEKEVINRIHAFYNLISTGDFYDVFPSFLSFRLMKKIGFQKFAKAYAWTVAFEAIHIFDIKEELYFDDPDYGPYIVCKVYIEEVVDLTLAFEMLHLDQTFINISNFFKWTQKLQTLQEIDENFVPYDYPELSIYLHQAWENHTNNLINKNHKEVPKSRKIFRHFYQFKFIESSGKLLIDEINVIENY